MTTFAPPVHRGDFLFSSLLYADAGNDNRHPRASIAELNALLRPDTPKPNGRKGKALEPVEPLKDPPWHFWTAQLLHYGQSSTKDKNTAKVRLLSALNGGRLEVPGWITKLETELKKEWEAENRKLKKTTKLSVPTAPVGTLVTTKNKESGKKKSKAPASSPPPMRPATKKRETNKTTSKATSASATTTGSKIAQGKRKIEELTTPEDSHKKVKLKKTESIKPFVETKSSEIARKYSGLKTVKTEEDDPWPTPQRIIIPHKGGYFVDRDLYADTRPNTAPEPGVYRVSCPDMEAEWSDSSIDEFFLAFSASENEWWSRFKWGGFQGMIVLDRIPKRANKTVGVPFKWRAHYAPGNEDGEGIGKIFFTSTTEFRGEFHSLFRERMCLFRAKQVQTARKSSNNPSCESFGTPVLDQMRIEWGQMPAIMKDVPEKKPRINKKKPPKSTRQSSSPSSSEQEYKQHDIQLSGTYRIDSSVLHSAFPDCTPSSFNLALITDKQRGVWWAKFIWGAWSGIIQFNPGPTVDTIHEAHSLGWRIKDLDTGERRFGRNCTGEMRFNHLERTLEGYLFGVPHVEVLDFKGKRIPGPSRVQGLQNEWDAFVNETYRR